MRSRCCVLAVALLMGACIDLHEAEDCNLTLTCPLPSNPCQGTCVPVPVAAPFLGGPYLVWMGQEQPPSGLCATPLQDFFAGTAPPMALVCPTCGCSQSTGSCALPTTTTASEAACTGSGPSSALNAPSAWDGACASVVPSSDIESVTAAPVIMKDSCTPHEATVTGPAHPPQSWSNVFACKGSALGACSTGDACEPPLPGPPPSPESAFMWSYCMSLEDPTKSCPSGTFPIRRSFGDGWTDTQTCTPCTCSSPVGSSCSPSTVTVFSDDECSDEVGYVEAQTSTSTCGAISVPSSLGSMSATPSVYTPGMCTHSGGIGGAPPTTADPMIFCCQE